MIPGLGLCTTSCACTAMRDEAFPCVCAVEIRHCAQLREVSLEGNRLATPVIDLRALARLRSLQLFSNPLEFLPELSPCTSLRHLSLANVSVYLFIYA